MRKRLRKKLRRGEFRETGFAVSARLYETADPEALWERWIDFVEMNGMDCGGGGLQQWSCFLAAAGRGSLTEEHRALVERWLRETPEVERFVVGPLVDAWHGPFEELALFDEKAPSRALDSPQNP